jgi:hypothetical protein
MWKNPEVWLTTKQLKADPDLSTIPVLFSSFSKDDNLGKHLGTVEVVFKPVDSLALHTVLSRLGTDGEQTHILAFAEDGGLVETIHQLAKSQPDCRFSFASELGRAGIESLTHPPDGLLVDLFQTEANKQIILDFIQTVPRFPGVPVVLVAEVEKTPTQHAILSWVGQSLQNSGLMRLEDILKNVDLAIRSHGRNPK